MQIVTIRGERHTVFDAINRQLAHYSYHIGQIVYIAKWLNGERWTSLSATCTDEQQAHAQLL